MEFNCMIISYLGQKVHQKTGQKPLTKNAFYTKKCLVH